jgi:hypothetical protein
LIFVLLLLVDVDLAGFLELVRDVLAQLEEQPTGSQERHVDHRRVPLPAVALNALSAHIPPSASVRHRRLDRVIPSKYGTLPDAGGWGNALSWRKPGFESR